MVVADNLKDFTFWMQYPFFESISSIELSAMLFGYSMQIFADFAGYSLIAIGIAGLFGYQLRDNFMFPYISSSFSEFWRRWHISLSTFLKEYLYIPLGGNRKGNLRTYFNLVVTMILGGLWHGAAWSYAVWGIYHGFALAIERLLNQTLFLKSRDADAFQSDSTFVNFFYAVAQVLFVFIVVSLGWLLFKLPDFSQVIQYAKCMVTNPFVPGDKGRLFFITIYSIPVVLYHLHYLLASKSMNYKSIFVKFQFLLYGFLLFLVLTNSGSSGDFIYFQF